ncbi:MAG: hypothetical protein QM660_09005 [Dysgonomonas sp.]
MSEQIKETAMTDINKDIIVDFEDDDCDYYLEESRCQRCNIEISYEEDNNNLGLCNECYKEKRL